VLLIKEADVQHMHVSLNCCFNW